MRAPHRVLVWAAFAGLSCAPALALRAEQVPVLAAVCYHRFGPETRLDPYRISTRRLAEQLAWLRRDGWQGVSLSQVAAALDGDPKALPAKGVLLSVDDGYKAGALGAPVFERYGYRAVYFIYPSVIGHGAFLSWDDLHRLEARGHEVAGHSLTHPNLAKPGPDMDPAAYAAWVRHELKDSKDILERAMGHAVPALAWPYGAYNPALVAAARAAGYTQLWTVSGGLNRPGALDAMRLRRILLMGTPSLDSFRRRLQALPADASLDGLNEGDLIYRSQLPMRLRVEGNALAALSGEPLAFDPVPGAKEVTLPADLGNGFHFLAVDQGLGGERHMTPLLFQVAPDSWKPYFQAITPTLTQ